MFFMTVILFNRSIIVILEKFFIREILEEAKNGEWGSF